MTAMAISGIQAALGVVAALIALAVMGGGFLAILKSSSMDARLKRLQDERDDYLSRLNYIEPKLVEVEQKNKVLMSLHNPTAQLEGLATQEQQHHDETVALIADMGKTLRDAITRTHRGQPSKDQP